MEEPLYIEESLFQKNPFQMRDLLSKGKLAIDGEDTVEGG